MAPLPPIFAVERMLIRDRLENSVHRVVFVDSRTDHTWLCRIDDDSWPKPVPSSSLLRELNCEGGRYTVDFDDPWQSHALDKYPIASDMAKLSDSEKRHAQRYDLITPLISTENFYLILVKKYRVQLIKERLKNVKSSRQTLSHLLKLFWKGGMTYGALHTDYYKCGGRGRRRKLNGPKVGAPRRITPGIGINATEDIQKILRVGADFYLSRAQPTLQEAHDRIVRLYFSSAVKDQDGKVVEFDVVGENKPTPRQLQYFINTHYSEQHVRRRRHGDKNWDLHEREILGLADKNIQGPGDQFQIDATIADVYLVSQLDRRRIVGRPVVYFVVDVFSRLIAGVYIGFEGPSWIGAMMAMVSMVTPKVEFCRQFGIEIEPSEWPSHYAPKVILADRGELMSVRLGHNITNNLRIEIDNASPGRADLKALVERRFGIVPVKFRQFTPGYVEKDFNERGVRDYRLDAALNLYEFTQMMIFAVLEHNASPISRFKTPPDMVTDGLTACPNDLWEWGIMNRSGCLRTFTTDEVALNVMPTDSARVTAKGIAFKGEFYSTPSALQTDWFSKARSCEWSIKVSFDPRNLEHLYVQDTKLPVGYEIARLINRNSNYAGKSLFELEEISESAKRVTALGNDQRQAKRILYDHRQSEIEKKAMKRTTEVLDKSSSRAERTSS